MSAHIISTILKHDAKVASYKIALLRSINDVVLSYPDLRTYHSDVAVPLRMLAEYWVAYYWPFVNPVEPILQGLRSQRAGMLRNDVSFRPQLTQLRQAWETLSGSAKPADGFWLINELRVPRKRASYPSALLKLYQQALNSISKAEPGRVYLHTGTADGAKALGLNCRRESLDPDELPTEFRRLTPREIEDCLCLYKDEFAGV